MTDGELRTLLTEASPLPWTADGKDGKGNGRRNFQPCLCVDCEFVRAAVNALPGHLDRIEKLEAMLKDVLESLSLSANFELDDGEKAARRGLYFRARALLEGK